MRVRNGLARREASSPNVRHRGDGFLCLDPFPALGICEIRTFRDVLAISFGYDTVAVYRSADCVAALAEKTNNPQPTTTWSANESSRYRLGRARARDCLEAPSGR